MMQNGMYSAVTKGRVITITNKSTGEAVTLNLPRAELLKLLDVIFNRN